VWVFEAPRAGSVVAEPRVTPEAVYLAAVHAHGLTRGGAVYALNPATGKARWSYDADGGMLPTASTPLIAGGHLYVGEGMHSHFVCRLHCLDAASGRAAWTFATGDHVEGGPAELDGTVYFPAGNDGLYALDAASGARKWNFRADLHIDSTPCVSGGRVYTGSGRSRRFDTHQVVCLDAATGKPLWRTPCELPAWGSPVVADGRVFVGLGNGRLTESAMDPEKPAGALACLDAETGRLLWAFPTGDAVFGRPVVVNDRVVFGSRDGHVYAVATDGREVFRLPMGAPVVGAVTASRGRLYAVSAAGRIVCVDAGSGSELWRHELARPGTDPLALAAPVVAGGRLYVAAEMVTGGTGIVSLFCFELPTPEEHGP
jgi:outer membrane protein assembly factor BamB